MYTTPPQLAPINSIFAVSSEKSDLIFTGNPPSHTQVVPHSVVDVFEGGGVKTLSHSA